MSRNPRCHYVASEVIKRMSFMWSVTSSSNIESIEPEMLQSSNKQHVHGESPVKSVYSDKNYQETQTINMWPVKPKMNMWSMPRPAKLQSKYKKRWLPKPVVPYQYTRLCNDKNCQSTWCFKKKDQVKSV